MFKVRMSLFACLALGMVFSVPASAQNIITVAGGGPNNAPAVSANLNGPIGVAVDASGNVYVADTNNHRIRVISLDGTVRTIAGTGVGGNNGDVNPPTASQLNAPRKIVLDGAGNIYFVEPPLARSLLRFTNTRNVFRGRVATDAKERKTTPAAAAAVPS